MIDKFLAPFLVAGALAACQPQLPFGGDGSARGDEHGAAERARASAPPPEASTGTGEEVGAGPAAAAELRALARPPRGEETVCRTFARKIAEAALRHGTDADAFMGELQDEFIGGKDNPFDMKRGLREGAWNQRYFYAGHGGFRAEYDDAERYPTGGNHQPGHFVSVLSIAHQFGEEQARIGIAVAGDYDPGEEDDLRLSMVAIPLGAGLRDGTVAPAEVAQRARQLCRA
jgi:hypothetical protein